MTHSWHANEEPVFAHLLPRLPWRRSMSGDKLETLKKAADALREASTKWKSARAATQLANSAEAQAQTELNAAGKAYEKAATDFKEQAY